MDAPTICADRVKSLQGWPVRPTNGKQRRGIRSQAVGSQAWSSGPADVANPKTFARARHLPRSICRCLKALGQLGPCDRTRLPRLCRASTKPGQRSSPSTSALLFSGSLRAVRVSGGREHGTRGMLPEVSSLLDSRAGPKPCPTTSIAVHKPGLGHAPCLGTAWHYAKPCHQRPNSGVRCGVCSLCTSWPPCPAFSLRDSCMVSPFSARAVFDRGRGSVSAVQRYCSSSHAVHSLAERNSRAFYGLRSQGAS